MPTLIYTTNNTPRGGTFNSRVLIGRMLSHGVVVDDPAISRLHAWIDPMPAENSDWLLTDAGSKVGTYVNEHRISKQALHDGDVIRVGTLKVTYRDENTLPASVKSVELTSPTGTVQTAGILFNCHCGAPLWVGNALAGKRGMCRHCQTPVTVPHLAPVTNVVTPPTTRQSKCGVCHAVIEAGAETTQCPDCAVNFHAECWQENLGCSSYGCPQVNALQAAPAIDQSTVEEETNTPPGLPWGAMLLAASIIGSVLGSLLFGALAAIVALTSIVVLIGGKYPRRGLLVVAMILSILGIVAGLVVSDFWYFAGRHLPEIGVHYHDFVHMR